MADDTDLAAEVEGDIVLDGEPEQQEERQAEGQEPEDEFAIEIEGELAEEEPPLVKTLRQEIRDRDRELAEHRKIQAPKIELGEKPTLESSEWDEERFERDLTAWHDRKRQIESHETQAAEQAQVRNQENQRRFANYRAAAAALPVKDFEAAEQAVVSVLPDTPDRPFQQALLNYTKEPAKLVYALSKHPTKLAALAQETDPIRVILALNEMERNLKVVTRKRPPAPEAETIVRGSAPASRVDPDKEMARLEKAAAISGDRTAIIEYKRKLKEKGK